MSVKNPYAQKNPILEYREMMSHNRSTLYHYFKDKLNKHSLKIGKGVYKVFTPPHKWETAYLTIDDIRFTDFQAIILFTNELVVRYGNMYENSQVNIPYRIINTIQLDNELDIGYEELYLNKK